MGRGWRRAFCTTTPTSEMDSEQLHHPIQQPDIPKSCAKVGFFSSISNPSTPRLRVRTSSSSSSSSNNNIKLGSSNPSSPRSPFSILKNTLRLSKPGCPLCLHSLKSGLGTPIYTAECSHSFHFPCISSHVRRLPSLICPVCNVSWKDFPLLAFPTPTPTPAPHLLLFNDDDPLLSPRFIPIPEEHCHGPPRNVEVKLLPEAAIISRSRSYETFALALRIKAPPTRPTHRPPIDLVTLLDVSSSMTGSKLQMLKRAMRLVISSLASADRLSIVAFASAPQRLLPLRRMTPQGQNAARKIIDQLACAQGTSVSEALRTAAKVLEDRKQKNPVCSIILLSDGVGHKDRQGCSSTRFAHIQIPVHPSGLHDAFAMCVGVLLSVVVQDLRVQLGFASGSAPAEIMAVYSCHGRPSFMSSDSARLGDLYAEEEREVLIEVKVTTSAIAAHHVMCVRSSYKDPVSGEVMYGRERALLVPRPHAEPRVERLRNRFIYTRAVAESRRLVEHGDYSSAHHLISSARSLLDQSTSAEEYSRGLEAELAHVHWRSSTVDENGEPLTPMSAWRAAEKLAKVAIINKSVSDLHGFENARF